MGVGGKCRTCPEYSICKIDRDCATTPCTKNRCEVPTATRTLSRSVSSSPVSLTPARSPTATPSYSSTESPSAAATGSVTLTPSASPTASREPAPAIVDSSVVGAQHDTQTGSGPPSTVIAVATVVVVAVAAVGVVALVIARRRRLASRYNSLPRKDAASAMAVQDRAAPKVAPKPVLGSGTVLRPTWRGRPVYGARQALTMCPHTAAASIPSAGPRPTSGLAPSDPVVEAPPASIETAPLLPGAPAVAPPTLEAISPKRYDVLSLTVIKWLWLHACAKSTIGLPLGWSAWSEGAVEVAALAGHGGIDLGRLVVARGLCSQLYAVALP